jgi:hypothetical protein
MWSGVIVADSRSLAAHMPAITHSRFGVGFAEPDLIRGAVIDTLVINDVR